MAVDDLKPLPALPCVTIPPSSFRTPLGQTSTSKRSRRRISALLAAMPHPPFSAPPSLPQQHPKQAHSVELPYVFKAAASNKKDRRRSNVSTTSTRSRASNREHVVPLSPRLLDQLRVVHQRQRHALAVLQSEAHKNTALVSSLRAETESLRSQRDVFRGEVARLRLELAELRNSSDKRGGEVEDLRRRNKALQIKLSAKPVLQLAPAPLRPKRPGDDEADGDAKRPRTAPLFPPPLPETSYQAKHRSEALPRRRASRALPQLPVARAKTVDVLQGHSTPFSEGHIRRPSNMALITEEVDKALSEQHQHQQEGTQISPSSPVTPANAFYKRFGPRPLSGQTIMARAGLMDMTIESRHSRPPVVLHTALIAPVQETAEGG